MDWINKKFSTLNYYIQSDQDIRQIDKGLKQLSEKNKKQFTFVSLNKGGEKKPGFRKNGHEIALNFFEKSSRDTTKVW